MVREVRHRADEERRDEQRDKIKAAGRDWQEEDARAHGRAEERDGPLRIKGALGRRSLIHYDLQFFAGFLSSDNGEQFRYGLGGTVVSGVAVGLHKRKIKSIMTSIIVTTSFNG